MNIIYHEGPNGRIMVTYGNVGPIVTLGVTINNRRILITADASSGLIYMQLSEAFSNRFEKENIIDKLLIQDPRLALGIFLLVKYLENLNTAYSTLLSTIVMEIAQALEASAPLPTFTGILARYLANMVTQGALTSTGGGGKGKSSPPVSPQ